MLGREAEICALTDLKSIENIPKLQDTKEEYIVLKEYGTPLSDFKATTVRDPVCRCAVFSTYLSIPYSLWGSISLNLSLRHAVVPQCFPGFCQHSPACTQGGFRPPRHIPPQLVCGDKWRYAVWQGERLGFSNQIERGYCREWYVVLFFLLQF